MTTRRKMSWMRSPYLTWPLGSGVLFGLAAWYTGRPVYAFVLWAITQLRPRHPGRHRQDAEIAAEVERRLTAQQRGG